MIPTKLSHLMAGLIPDAEIRIYKDAAHAFLFRYAEQGRRRHQRVPGVTQRRETGRSTASRKLEGVV
jgi:hypothetical protein